MSTKTIKLHKSEILYIYLLNPSLKQNLIKVQFFLKASTAGLNLKFFFLD